MIKNILNCLIIMSCALYLAACCSKDQTCPAGDASENEFPYKLGEQLIFADSLGHIIKIKLSNQLTKTAEYTEEGSCGMPRKDLNCVSSTSISDAGIEDSSGVLGNKTWFTCGIQKNDVAGRPMVSYFISAFGQVLVGLGNYNTEPTTDKNVVVLPTYKTPYKTYTNVYSSLSATSGSNVIKPKAVFTLKGQLISFTLNKDTTRFYYLVE